MSEDKPSGGSSQRSWGASLIGDGKARFRIWAPAEERLLLVLNGSQRPMHNVDDGWFELTEDGVRAGDAYFFQLSDGTQIADPASTAQLDGVEGPSIVTDQGAYRWRNPSWRGRPWDQAVIYELHIGTFTPQGTFAAAMERLPHLQDAGITALEIMPVAHFPGERGWGYDGVLHYAPHTAYGGPEDLKAFVDAAHSHGMMVLLDVVYNHFGPQGNYLQRYAPQFFRPDRPTPWGASIAFEEPAVRRYFTENALYWLDDFRFDGLRFDATEQIEDAGPRHFLDEMARELRDMFPDRDVHLTVEDQNRRRGLLRRDHEGKPVLYTAGWNDDLHHALHVIATGENKGYYKRYAGERDRWPLLGKSLSEGFVFSSEEHENVGSWSGKPLPPDVNVNFLQNHDQVGNRAFGERLSVLADETLLKVMTAMLILTPQVPLLFMGEEYGERRPFYFFADYDGDIARAIRVGRKQEAENFGGMPDGKGLEDLPDPISRETFERSRLDWSLADSPQGREHTAFLRTLIALRQRHVRPLLSWAGDVVPEILPAQEGVVAVNWVFPSGALRMRANLTNGERPLSPASGETVFSIGEKDEGPAFLLTFDKASTG